MKRNLFVLALLLSACNVWSQTYKVIGHITDPQNRPIGFASIFIRNTTYGTSANEDGYYTFDLKPGTYNLTYRYAGYKERNANITVTNQAVTQDMALQADSFLLNKSQGENAAKAIIQQAINKRKFYLNQVPAYKAAVYIKGVQKLLSAPPKMLRNGVSKAFELDRTGKGILYQAESLSEYNFKQPNKVKEVLIASKMAGQNTAFSYNKASDFDVNFYKNELHISGLSARSFISPIASNAMHYYNYKLLGSRTANGVTVDKIELLPKHQHAPVFRGIIYISEGDWRIYSTELLITKAAFINLVDTLKINQQYIPVTDEVWMPGVTQFTFTGDVLGFKFAGYYASVFNNYDLKPNRPANFFNGEILRIDTAANSRDTVYWNRTRPVPLTVEERRDYRRKDSTLAHRETLPYLDSVEHASNQLSPFGFGITGYEYTNRRQGEVIRVYPVVQSVYFNTVEGYGVMPKVKFTKTFTNGTSYSITPAVRYGFSNKQFNANVSLAYNYDPDHEGQFYGGFGSDILDLSDVGTRSLLFNTLSTLLYETNYVKYYRSRYGRLGFQHDLSNGILFNTELSYASRDQLYNTSANHLVDEKNTEYTSNNPLTPLTESPLFPHNNALTFKASLLFTFNRQYITRPTGRYYQEPKYPQLRLNYRKGMADVDYDFISADLFDDHLSLGQFGYTAYKFSAGDFINHNTLYFMDYNHFLGNEGTVFNPDIGNFHFLDFYSYSTNRSFFEGHVEHNFTGNILNRVPYIRRLKLEEIIGVNYLNSTSHDGFYEFYFGVKRFFLRFDYGFAYNGNHKVMQGIKIFYGLK